MIVYYSNNDSRDMHLLLTDISFYLEKYFNATLVEKKYNTIKDNDIEITLMDTQLLIHIPEQDRFIGIDFTDNQSRLVSFFCSRNNSNDILLYAQLAMTELYHKSNTYNFKTKNSIYTPSFPYVSLEPYYEKRKTISEYIDKFVFWGNYKAMNRKAVELLQNENLFIGGGYTNNYFDEIIKYKVGLAIPGIGELCYRDIEYMAVGVPLMKFEYITQLNPPLIPDYHYISVPRIDTPEDYNSMGGILTKEREAEQRHADAYLKRYKEIKDDNVFLNFISNNARKYYETYLHPDTRTKHIIDLLELN